jgi:hypothetical protein
MIRWRDACVHGRNNLEAEAQRWLEDIRVRLLKPSTVYIFGHKRWRTFWKWAIDIGHRAGMCEFFSTDITALHI